MTNIRNAMMAAAGGAAGGFIGGCYFDGSTYYARDADWSGLDDGKLGTISFWMRQDSVNDGAHVAVYPFQNSAGIFFLYMATGNHMLIGIFGWTGYVWKVTTSADSFKSTEGWVHFVASWDLGNTVGHVYVNGVSDQATVGQAPIDYTIDYTKSLWGICTNSNTPGNGPFIGDMAQFYFNDDEYVDLSDAANLAKFYDEGPVDFGSDGSLPTGTSPIFFMNRTASGAVTDFDTNAGTGGSADITRTGTLTESSNIPETGLVA